MQGWYGGSTALETASVLNLKMVSVADCEIADWGPYPNDSVGLQPWTNSNTTNKISSLWWKNLLNQRYVPPV
jgi:hypothetical protein